MKTNSTVFEFTEFNLNNECQVKLTEFGRKCLLKNYTDSLKSIKEPIFQYAPPTEDDHGWSSWQLWELMAQLGKHISNGMNPPFNATIRLIIEPK